MHGACLLSSMTCNSSWLEHLAGALVAAATDLTFNAYGYAAVLFNDFLTASYLIMVKNTPAASALSTTGLLFYNAMLSLPLLMAAVWSSGEWSGIWLYPLLNNPEFLVSTRVSSSPQSRTFFHRALHTLHA